MVVEVDEFDLTSLESDFLEELTGLFFVNLSLHFQYQQIGRYRPGTLYDPPEYPEDEIFDIVVTSAVLGDDTVLSIDQELSLIIVDHICWQRIEKIGIEYGEQERWKEMRAINHFRKFPHTR